MHTPLRDFLRTETGSASVLLAAAVAALAWANAAPSSYEGFWHTELAMRFGAHGLSLDLREWVNSGLMTLFFFVVGLEARREFDMGELRERRRATLPAVVGLAGMAVPVLVYVACNAGHASAHGWGVAMSTDTAFALGMLALIGKRLPAGLRIFILTISVVDDFVALAVIAVVYSGHIEQSYLWPALACFTGMLALHRTGAKRPVFVAVAAAAAAWLMLRKSGVEPVIVGLALGLLTSAYPANRDALERASGLFQAFREQPTPELARDARIGVASAISPNARLQRLYHPWTSYGIVPLFALANSGLTISTDEASTAFTSPITLGIIAAYVLGKPAGVIGTSWLISRLRGGSLRPAVGWGALAAGGAITGVGFTVSLLIATLAFSGRDLTQAKIGVLSAVVLSVVTTWLIAWTLGLLPEQARIRSLLGSAESIVDLVPPVNDRRDHVRGPVDAPVTVVEFGDFECPYCGRAEPVMRDLLAHAGDVRYVWRHLPLTDVHPHAQLAAEAAQAAGDQGAFWEMHDALLAHQGALATDDVTRYAEEIGLDIDRFHTGLSSLAGATRIAEDVESADRSGVSGTPAFFINGRRHDGAYDIESLTAAVKTARLRVSLQQTARRRLFTGVRGGEPG
ncbi:Na+/H+ antiporter NhaA (plasmid) [Streptomyces sp. NBC_00841]|uniref:Na+/H+ antiporter NhaA n=1 Tax=Streptomyces sp. NBC_00841 TaxID=2975847 RepID=UPI002DD7C9A5|nr:Na+/H+ antiporter NhaA [Streptomyces sp. NBC_00841]WSA04906.1 Na+/H+ antiporter NhaA [Streptomyces sp. NBC_00841]